MLFSRTSTATALVAVTFLSQATLSVAGGHRHRARSHSDLHAAKRVAAGSVELPLSEVQMLQSEYNAFKFWIDTWLNTTGSEAPAISAAQLKQEFQAYDGWITTWLDSALNNGQPSAPASLPSSIPLPSTGQSATAASSRSAPASSHPVSLTIPKQKVKLPDTEAAATSAHSYDDGKYHWTATGVGSGHAASPVAGSGSGSSSTSGAGSGQAPAPVPAPAPAQGAGSSSAAVVAPSASAASGSSSASSLAPPAGGSGGSSSAGGSDQVAVYWGASAASASVPLANVCSDPSVDIVILAFYDSFSATAGTPELAIGNCAGVGTCDQLAQDIKSCQSAHKKVILSLGGANAVGSFSSDQDAQTFATTLWNQFGGGSDAQSTRPFGSVKVDGFDIDAENKQPAHWTAFVTAMRSAMDGDKSKTYFISAAPQCPRPDASIPLDAMQAMDFVWVQFYNNPPCAVGTPGFQASFEAWSSDLSAKGTGPKLFIGAPASTSASGSGYVDAGQMGGIISGVKSAKNFGGVMLWDAAYAVENANYQKAMKSALG